MLALMCAIKYIFILFLYASYCKKLRFVISYLKFYIYIYSYPFQLIYFLLTVEVFYILYLNLCILDTAFLM